MTLHNITTDYSQPMSVEYATSHTFHQNCLCRSCKEASTTMAINKETSNRSSTACSLDTPTQKRRGRKPSRTQMPSTLPLPLNCITPEDCVFPVDIDLALQTIKSTATRRRSCSTRRRSSFSSEEVKDLEKQVISLWDFCDDEFDDEDDNDSVCLAMERGVRTLPRNNNRSRRTSRTSSANNSDLDQHNVVIEGMDIIERENDIFPSEDYILHDFVVPLGVPLKECLRRD